LSYKKTPTAGPDIPHHKCDTAICCLPQVLQAKQHKPFFFASKTKMWNLMASFTAYLQMNKNSP